MRRGSVWVAKSAGQREHRARIRRLGNTVVIAESERATGQVSEAVLDALAEVAVQLPRT